MPDRTPDSREKIVELDFYDLFTYEFGIGKKWKYGYEGGQYLTVFDDFAVVSELRSKDFQRHQTRQNPLGLVVFRGPFLIHPESIFRKWIIRIHFVKKNSTRKYCMENAAIKRIDTLLSTMIEKPVKN